jgi:5-dehydro-4-deoxyglucarate dehydratase
VFNFAPRSATAFYGAVLGDDLETYDAFVTNFLLPYLKIRGRQPGYAVSIVKAGAEIVGRSAGKVRPPLSDLTPQEYEELSSLIARLGPQE